ncbi:MAG TPA: DUF2100 domain-containing protein [Methanothermococcus okinawensis]|uniref:DUF2100 domain-containing protein n=1 Tax=Methanothermococcus okinawensis TaxID=155863 RepID=A0A833E4B7_9EURY|nr:DUF2100 domain-containing protein [Methanococcaceae archaeon]HIP83946.1 DUF2100 domain-containing protein [Methanothermococcus okinawensis]HIP91535.1 DUF2100 domain-containing protein [Methanothermococcus okinawensis]
MDRMKDSKALIKRAISTIHTLKRREGSTLEVRSPVSYRDAKAGRIDIEEFKNAVYTLLEADDYLYRKAPHHRLEDREAKEFCKLIFKCKKHLDKVLEGFDFKFQGEVKLKEDKLYIVSSKKLLRSLKSKMPEINVISTDGVLHPEDMKTLRPDISEKALKGISKKCEIIRREIEKLIEKLKPSEVVVIVDESNRGDQLVYLRARELYGAKKIDIEDLDL